MAERTFTVSEVNGFINRVLTGELLLQHIAVSGEASNVKYHTASGHLYFYLKDQGSCLRCVMFNYAKKLTQKIAEGSAIVVTGQIKMYEATGEVQLYAASIKSAGIGVLYEQFEALKKELSEAGLFDASFKKPIPPYAKRVGVVTAQTGAVIHDICSTALRKNPSVQLVLCPCNVQGKGAAPTIVSAIKTLDTMGLDCIIVGRGGGSIEDLWAFNEREVAYAIFEAVTPIISAVGHDTDFTIADFVADYRALTPTAGAEKAVFDRDAFFERVGLLEDKMEQAMQGRIKGVEDRFLALFHRLNLKNPGSTLMLQKSRSRELSNRLLLVMKNRVNREILTTDAKKTRLLLAMKNRVNREILTMDANKTKVDGLTKNMKKALEQRLYQAEVKRQELARRLEAAKRLWEALPKGMCSVSTKDKKPLTSVQMVQPGDTVTISLADGSILTRVEQIGK